jgi:hypothetical protein
MTKHIFTVKFTGNYGFKVIGHPGEGEGRDNLIDIDRQINTIISYNADGTYAGTVDSDYKIQLLALIRHDISKSDGSLMMPPEFKKGYIIVDWSTTSNGKTTYQSSRIFNINSKSDLESLAEYVLFANKPMPDVIEPRPFVKQQRPEQDGLNKYESLAPQPIIAFSRDLEEALLKRSESVVGADDPAPTCLQRLSRLCYFS